MGKIKDSPRNLLFKNKKLLNIYNKYKQNYQYFLSLYYLGANFECPFCHGRFRKLIPNIVSKVSQDVTIEKSIVGFGYRQNCWCPRCLSFERERLLYIFLKTFTSIFSNDVRVLHFAPGKNLEKILKSKNNIRYITVDLHRNSVMTKMDIEDICFKKNSFDFIICSHILNFVLNDIKALSELHRILKPGGFAYIIVPYSLTSMHTYEDPLIISKEERKRAFGDVDLLRIYGKDLNQRLAKVGFEVEEFKWENHKERFGGDANKFGLLKNEIIFIAKKS